MKTSDVDLRLPHIHVDTCIYTHMNQHIHTPTPYT